MGISVEGQAGIRSVADGSDTELRLDRVAALVTTDAHGRYREATGRGGVYSASTGTAGVAPGTALSTTPPLILWNPANSGVVLSVLKTRMAYVSGTLGSGVLVYAYTPSQLTKPSGGTVLTAQANKLSGASGTGQAFQGSTLAATPTLLFPMGSVTPELATSVVAPLVLATDEVAGEIEVPQGCALCIQEVGAAGTTPLVMLAITWEEIPA